MKEIPLTRGKVALVDDEDFERINKHQWSLMRQALPSGRVKEYAIRSEKGKMILMHREILNAPEGMEVDHRFGDGLDNQKKKLRLATRAENARNCATPRVKKTSQFRGVCWNSNLKSWESYIHMNDRHIHLNNCKDEHEAAYWHDAAARKYHGEFARLNFPDVHFSLEKLKERHLERRLENKASKYRGVYWNKKRKNWLSVVKWKGKRITLKQTRDEGEAAIYADVARQIFGITPSTLLPFPL